jgi:hypothetical protein
MLKTMALCIKKETGDYLKDSLCANYQHYKKHRDLNLNLITFAD